MPDRERVKPKPWVALAIGVLAMATVLVAPMVLDAYSVTILIRSLLYSSIAVSLDILWGYAGILSFGQAAFFGIGAYAFGLAVTTYDFGALTVLGAFVAGPAAAAAVAGLVAWLGFGPRVSPLYISVITLVQSVIFVQLIYSGGDVTGSSSGLSGFDTFDLDMSTWFRIAGVALVLITAAGFVFVRSDYGRLLVAIRENEQRCRYSGIGSARVKTMLLIGSAIVASLAGIAYAAFNDVIAPDLGSFQFGTELVIWVALGGRGTLLGPAVAAVLIDYVSAILSGTLPFVWQLVVGLVFIVVIVLLPGGLGPALFGAVRRRRTDLATGPAYALDRVPDRDIGASGSAAIVVAGVARHYGSLRVLEGIDFSARPGELVSIIGPNGAGKTTLIRCISDGLERSAGSVTISGQPIGRLPPEACVRLGLGRKFQAPNVFDALTVGESLRIARYRFERLSPLRRAERINLPAAALRVVEATGLVDQLGTLVKHLSHGGKQVLELAMVLALEPSVLLLDEPTAGLSKAERTLIGTILVDLVRDHGLCVLLIEHDLEFVREISSRIIVLHQGRIRVLGEDVTGIRPHRLSERSVSYSPQDQAIFGELTVEENLRLGLRQRSLFAAGLERVAAFFPVLAQRRAQKAGTLSGGEQKMLIMARALLAQPALMLVDEITEGLQPSVIARLADVLRAQRDAGTAILLIEQNIGFALAVADRYAVLARGEIVASGAAEPGADSGIADHLAV